MYFKFSIAFIFVTLLIGCGKGSNPVPPNNGGSNNGNGAAVFTLQGNGSTCMNSSVSGTYTRGTSLSSSNTVTIQVNVLTVGSWSVATNTVSGFSFSGSGTFVTAGAQSITLAGSGTPNTAGSKSFSVTAVNNSCEFSVLVAPVINTGITIIEGTDNPTYFFNNQSTPLNAEFERGVTVSLEQNNTVAANYHDGVTTYHNFGIATATTTTTGFNVAPEASKLMTFTSTASMFNLSRDKLNLYAYVMTVPKTSGTHLIDKIGTRDAIDTIYQVMGKVGNVVGNGTVSLKDFTGNANTAITTVTSGNFEWKKSIYTWP